MIRKIAIVSNNGMTLGEVNEVAGVFHAHIYQSIGAFSTEISAEKAVALAVEAIKNTEHEVKAKRDIPWSAIKNRASTRLRNALANKFGHDFPLEMLLGLHTSEAMRIKNFGTASLREMDSLLARMDLHRRC